MWDTLASEAVDLYATSLAGDIHAAYEAGLLNPGYMQPSEVDSVTPPVAPSRSRRAQSRKE